MGLTGVFPEEREVDCIAVIVAMCLLSVVLGFQLAPCSAQLSQFASDFGRRVRKYLQSRACKTALEQRIQDECDKRQLERAHVMLNLVNAMLLFTGANLLWGLATQMKASDVPRGPLVSFLVMVTGCALTSLFRRFLLTSRTLDMVYSLLMATQVSCVLLMEQDPFLFIARIPSILVMVFMHGLFNLRVWLNFIWLAVLACTMSAKVVLTGQSPVFVVHSFALMFAALAWISHCLTTSVRMEILAGDRGHHLTAVGTLLNTICDVVVELDGGLRMLQHSPKLADVLLRGGGRSLAGARFQDFMPEEADRESFVQHMNDLDETGAGGGVFHAKMRDSSNSNISMEFFSVAFRGSDARQRHILGMREFTDIAPVAHAPQRPPPPVELHLPRQEVNQPLRGTPAAVEQGDMRSHSRSSGPSSSSASQPFDRGSDDADSVSVPSGGFEVETKYMVRKISMAYLLFSWHFAKSGGACCPWHRVVAEAQRVISSMKSDPCDPEHTCTDRWQCKRCGIAANEYRDEAHPRQCKLCMELSTAELDLEAGGGSSNLSL